MKKLLFINLALISALILGSCGSSNSVVSNRLISKRKYTKGFHLNKRSKLKSDGDANADKDYVAKVDKKADRNKSTITQITRNFAHPFRSENS